MTAATAALSPEPVPGPGLGATADDTTDTITWADFRQWERQLATTGTCSHPSGSPAGSTPSTGPRRSRPGLRHRHRTRRSAARRVRQPPRIGLPGLLGHLQRDARQLVRASISGGQASPRPSPRIRACSPPSPPHRSARSTPAGCAAKRSSRAGHVATRTLAAARTATTSPAPLAMSRTIPGSGSRFASAATTMRPPSCSTPTRVTCGAGSPPTCRASSPGWRGHAEGAALGPAHPLRQGRRIPGTRHRPLPRRHPPRRTRPGLPAPTGPVHRRDAVRRHRPGRQHRHRHHRLGPAARLRAQTDARAIRHSSDLPGTGQALSGQAVANYIAKYATKTLTVPGVPDTRIRTAFDLQGLRCSHHYREMITAAWRLGARDATGEPRFRQWAHMLGYGGTSSPNLAATPSPSVPCARPEPSTAGHSATPAANAILGAVPSTKPSS